MKEIENVESARRNTQLVPMDLSVMGSQDQKFQGNCVDVELTATWREIVERKQNTCNTIKQVDGLKTRAKASFARAKATAKTKEW